MMRLLTRIVVFMAALWLGGFGFYVASVRLSVPYQGKAEGIVVLTGGDRRVDTGIRLLAEDHAEHLLISGVHPSVRIRDLLKEPAQQAVSARVTLGFSAYNTAGNASETRDWVSKHAIRSLIVVTSDYHMTRALMHLGSQLPDVTLYRYPVQPDLFRADTWYTKRESWALLWTEYHKVLLTYPQIYFLS